MEARNGILLQSVSADTLSREQRAASPEHHSHAEPNLDETPPYEASQEEVLPPYEDADNSPVRIRSTPLHRNFYIIIPTALYSALVIYSWVTFCLLTRLDGFFEGSVNIRVHQFKAARYTQSIASVATIPVISTVCAWAAAVYVQNQRDAYSLRLRQVITLADRSWMDPLLWYRLLFYPKGLKRYGSSFLVLAIFIHFIGAITYPIQSLFLSTRQVNIQPSDSQYSDANQMVKSISGMLESPGTADTILTLRGELQSPGLDAHSSQFWTSGDDTWFAELSNDFTTGLHSGQLIPRVNVTAEYQNLTATSTFPSNCNETGGWFYSSYYYPGENYNTTLEVCLAVNTSQTPWQDIDSRQDFTEELYVNASNPSNIYQEELGAFKITMKTTAGAFELPNFENNQTAGPLLNDSPPCLSMPCSNYTASGSPYDPPLAGPLTTIAIALFGPGSYADIAQTALNSRAIYDEIGWKGILDRDAYDNLYPLQSLGLKSPVMVGPFFIWLTLLTHFNNSTTLSPIFTQAGFLAIKAMFDTYPTIDESQNILISYSNSTLQQITLPSMSIGGLIVGSVLLGLYMVPLLCLALYAVYSHRWTNTLDAFTMLRMGAALGQKDLPLLVGNSMRKIQALDNLPGVVRDISGPDDKIRQMALGIEGGAPLQVSKRYLAYPGNNDTLMAVR